MIDQESLDKVLESYKQDLAGSRWEEEKFKWEAVKHFQDHWDINASASDFAQMLEFSLDKISKLTGSKFFPLDRIKEFAQAYPDTVREMFVELFDEDKEIFERIDHFKKQSDLLLAKHPKKAKNHFQTENAISIYLWLRYPDKYYIYKAKYAKAVSKTLKTGYQFINGHYEENFHHFLSMYDELNAALQKDSELKEILQSRLSEACYPDPQLKTLTIDLGHYIGTIYTNKENEKNENEIIYETGLSVEDWKELLENPDIFNENALKVLRQLKDYGGAATCSQLAQAYGEDLHFYLSNSVSAAKKVSKAKGIKPYQNQKGNNKWWPILYTGKPAEKEEKGVFIWKLQENLLQALQQIEQAPVKKPGYWWLCTNPKIWSFSSLTPGKERSLTLLNENNHKRDLFQNFLDAKAGDLVIGYESSPIKQITALGEISQKSEKELVFKKVEGLSSPIDYAALKEIPQLAQMEVFQNPKETLYKLDQEEYETLFDLIRQENPTFSEQERESYGKEDFLRDVYLDEEDYDRLVRLLENKKNIILQGAPGVGKSFAARRLAWAMMEEINEEQIELVQFHQNYAYEDFMLGYRPVEDGFQLQYGLFYRFCQRAFNHPEKKFFFLIDEINRGNLSKIFGELLMLIEKDYRGTRASLAYNGLSFFVPENLYLIGMMNTADRSLAMIDYALRRRFGFFKMKPGFDSDGFRKYQESLNNPIFDALITKVKALNEQIRRDPMLGEGFCIGHSYFCNQESSSEEWMKSVVEYEILPMLEEYWFDEPKKYQKWEEEFEEVFK